MTRHKVISVTASAQNLATALGIPDIAGTNACCVSFSLQALGGNSGIVWIGGSTDTLTATTNYGMRIEIPVSTVPSAPFFRESKSVAGYLNLSEWTFLGTPGDSLSVIVEFQS